MNDLVPIGTLIQTYRAGIWEIVGYQDMYPYKNVKLSTHHVLPSSEYADLNREPVKYYLIQKRYNSNFHLVRGNQVLSTSSVYPIGLLLTQGLKKHTKSLENLQKLIEINDKQYKFE